MFLMNHNISLYNIKFKSNFFDGEGLRLTLKCVRRCTYFQIMQIKEKLTKLNFGLQSLCEKQLFFVVINNSKSCADWRISLTKSNFKTILSAVKLG